MPGAVDRILGGVVGLSERGVVALSDESDAAHQHRGLAETAHRPWCLPGSPWLMGQTWTTLLFMHWRLPREQLEAVTPPQLSLDTFEGEAWIGVTPFLVSGLRLRGSPPMPWISRFPELNVRTYVTVEGKPGIYFLSLDAARPAAVISARRTYRLPYFHASMACGYGADGVNFSSERTSKDGRAATFSATYRAVGPLSSAKPGTLEYFLTERYCLYTLDERGRIHRGDIHHPPWPLQEAEAEIRDNTMTMPFGIDPGGDPVLHYAERQDVVIWRIRPVAEP